MNLGPTKIYIIQYYLNFTGSSSEEDDVSPRENIQKNSKGFSDFCVRRIAQVMT